MAMNKYPDVEFKTPEWLTAGELAGEYIVGSPNKIRLALLANEDMVEYVQRKRNGTSVPLCLRRDFVPQFCKITGLQPAEILPVKTQGWLTAHDLSDMYFCGGPKKILDALNLCQGKMPESIKKMRSCKNIVLCLRQDALDAFYELSGLNRKDANNLVVPQAKKTADTHPRNTYRNPDILVSMPSLLCSIFGRESR